MTDRTAAPQAEAVQAQADWPPCNPVCEDPAMRNKHCSATCRASAARSIASASDAAQTDSKLSEKDVFTILGYIEHLRLLGQTDMPAWFSDLAERMALSIGEAALANKVAALRVRLGKERGNG